jgi:N,N-dimethylformamidase beta subunit-like, C-terminal
MRFLFALVLAFSLTAGAAGAGGQTVLAVGNGTAPYAGDRADLTTISPNADGYRDTATISYAATRAGLVRLTVERQDRGPVLESESVPVAGGPNTLSWAPPSTTPPGTYVVRVARSREPDARAVVRVQGIDAAMGSAGAAQDSDVQLAVSTDAPSLTLRVLHMDESSSTTYGYDSVTGTQVGPDWTVSWAGNQSRPRNVTVHVGDWPSGVYFVELSSPDGRVGYAPLVVRPRRLGLSRLAIVMPTNTWQAYDFYDRDGDGHGDTWYAGWRTRLTRLGRPYLNHGVPSHFRRYDLQFLIWLARHHVRADFLTDADLEHIGSGAQLSRLYDLVVFPGHHEYVTEHEYDVVQGYRDRGGNLAWLSANNFFWKVVRHGPVLERVAKWRDLGRPEASLIGAEYRGNDEGQRRGPMHPVPGAATWLFAGTPMAHGRAWGDFGIEIDAAAPSSPPGTHVLARIPNLYGPGFTAEMTYYETKAGAKVFAAGAFSLATEATQPIGDRLLGNLLAHLEQP